MIGEEEVLGMIRDREISISDIRELCQFLGYFVKRGINIEEDCPVSYLIIKTADKTFKTDPTLGDSALRNEIIFLMKKNQKNRK